MTEKKTERKRANPQDYMPDAETVARELGKAQSMDDFFGKEGIFAKLFANTLEQMLEEELTEHLGYEKHALSQKKTFERKPEELLVNDIFECPEELVENLAGVMDAPF